MTKRTPAWDFEDARAQNLKGNQPAWRNALLDGRIDVINNMMKAGFNADYPVSAESRSPLIDIALIIPSGPAHEKALAEAARILINSGATLNLPDYKGLLPADYALISPNPLVAREIVLSTLRNETLKGLEKPYRPQLGILFCLSVMRSERVVMQDNLADNLAEIKECLQHKNLKEDPLLMAQNRENIDFWLNLTAPDHEDMPMASTSLRHLFRRVTVMLAQNEEDASSGRESFSAESIEDAKSQLRFQEWRHAQNFHI